MHYAGGQRNGFQRLEQELLQARFDTLARISRTLEEHLETLEHLREKIERAAGEEERSPLVAEFNQAREPAKRYRWYLEVQRDVMGLRNHGLDEFYRVPPRIEQM